MKKTTIIINTVLVLIIAAVCIGFIQPGDNTSNITPKPVSVSRGNNISDMINLKKQTGIFKEYSLFNNVPKDANSKVFTEFVRSGSTLSLKRGELQNFIAAKPENIIISLPREDNSIMQLELTKVNILAKDFNLLNKSTGRTEEFKGTALFYRGIIMGNENSFAVLSVFDDFVMGGVCDNTGNYVLGAVKDNNNRNTDNYVFYNDRNIIHQKPFICGDEGNEDRFRLNNKNNNNPVHNGIPGEDLGLHKDTVNVYFETDYQMYLDNQSNQYYVSQHVMGYFNEVATVYASENIPFGISQIGYWSSVDPYAGYNDSYSILKAFGETQKDNFMGDVAQFLTTGHGGGLGGIAWINVLCQPATQEQGVWVGRFSFANIDTSYNHYPVYSWTVTVITHEIGHNMGSYHTHACHWNLSPIGGGIGPLDTCIVTTENSSLSGNPGCIPVTPAWQCAQPDPPTSGFIMSYCHFCENNGGGINLINGFGRPFNSMYSQSGDTVRLRFSQASCITAYLNSSQVPLNFGLLQNYPNPYNPSTRINFALPVPGNVTLRVYDITGRQIAVLLNNKYYSMGVFSYDFDASLYNLASGIYLYKLDVSSDNKNVYSHVKKMVLVK